jgi:serine/threonine protein kinase
MLTLEFMRSGTLAEALPRLSDAQKFATMLALANGLAFLHSKKLIHRDIKPSNVLLDIEGDNFRAVLSDFGSMWDAEFAATITSATTAAYTAPELSGR